MEAVASAMPSMKPTVSVDAPSTPTRYSGSSAWIISEERSMNSDTNPSAQTLPGISRQRKMERGWVDMVQKSLWLIPPREKSSQFIAPAICCEPTILRGDRNNDDCCCQPL